MKFPCFKFFYDSAFNCRLTLCKLYLRDKTYFTSKLTKILMCEKIVRILLTNLGLQNFSSWKSKHGRENSFLSILKTLTKLPERLNGENTKMHKVFFLMGTLCDLSLLDITQILQ